MATTAGVLIAYGLRHRSAAGAMLAVGAVPLAYKGMTGQWPSASRAHHGDTRAALSGRRGIHVRESVRIEQPLSEVYRFWRQLENLPRFMTHLKSVTQQSDGRSHWVAEGPGGVAVEWDAEIINEVDNKVIGWQSLPGSDVATAGSVNFDAVRGGRTTQISVHLQYAAPGGRFGALVASIAGREPSQTIREDLRRLKQLLEAGEIARATAEVPPGSRR
jgi:uncharacterized membrane protein